MTLRTIAPEFLVADVRRTAEWYRDNLGFEIGQYFGGGGEHDHEHHREHGDEHGADHGHAGDGPDFVILKRDGVSLMLSRADPEGVRSNRAVKEISLDAYVWVKDIRPLFEACKARGLTFAYGLERTFYDMWEFAIADCDGHVVAFGE